MTTNVQDLPNGEQHEPAARDSVATFAAKINQLLADALSIYLKTKNFHWHVSGPHFRDYHLMLDEQASGILEAIDPLAERVRAAGSTTIRSLGQAAQLRTIADNNADDVAPDAMLAELMADNKALAASMRRVHKLCDELDDVATASILEGYIEAAEKRAWFLREAAQSRSLGSDALSPAPEDESPRPKWQLARRTHACSDLERALV
jgi:starvation-inducible DNA-binding protein